MSRKKTTAQHDQPPTREGGEVIQSSFIPEDGIMPRALHGATCHPSKPRQRWQFKFWLNVNNDEDLAIADLIGELKRQRQFQRAVRDGLRLIADLRAGRTDVLLELFPGIREALPQVGAGESFDALLREVSEIKAHLSTGGGLMPIPPDRVNVPLIGVKVQQINGSSDDAARNFLGGLASAFFDEE